MCTNGELPFNGMGKELKHEILEKQTPELPKKFECFQNLLNR